MYPFDPQAIISLQVKLEGLEDGLKRLEALHAELF
jgi:invasion protein IalB